MACLISLLCADLTNLRAAYRESPSTRRLSMMTLACARAISLHDGEDWLKRRAVSAILAVGADRAGTR